MHCTRSIARFTLAHTATNLLQGTYVLGSSAWDFW
jgi:hypothetical protein